MSDFIAPENSGPFIAPENSEYVAPENNKPSILGDVVKKAGQAALFPLTALAKPVANVAQAMVEPEPPMKPEDDPEFYDGKTGTFPNIHNYPNSLYTDPTVNDASNLMLGRDVAKLGVMGAKALMSPSVDKKALQAFIDSAPEINALPKQPELLTGGEAVKPEMGLERLKTARKDPVTGQVTVGHNSSEVQQKMLDMTKQAQADMETAYKDFLKTAKPGDKFDMGDGNYAVFKGGLPLEEGGPVNNYVDIFGDNLPPAHPAKSTLGADTLLEEKMLKAPTPEAANQLRMDHIKSKGFTDAKGDFIAPENAIERLNGQGPEAGQAFAQERPFISDKSGIKPEPLSDEVQTNAKMIQFNPQDIRQINKQTGMKLSGGEAPQELKFGEEIEKGSPTTPIQIQEPLSRPLPEGGKTRVKEFAALPSKDIDKSNPLTSRVELNKKLGSLEDTATSQFKSGSESAMKSREEAIKLKTDSKNIADFKPNSLEDKALDVYVQTDNKVEAYSRLEKTLGKDFADKVKAKDTFMRKQYDELLPQLNQMRIKNGEVPIPRRENYMPHFNEVSILQKLGLIDSVGTPEGAKMVELVTKNNSDPIYTRLKDVVFNHVKHQGTEYNVGPTEAFERYVDSAKNYIHMQPYVNELNATAEAVQGKLPNLSIYLKNQADYLAGKINPIDRTVKDAVGEGFIKAALQLQRNAVTNVVQGSPKVAFTQLFGTLPTLTKYDAQDVVKAIGKMVLDPEIRGFAYANSQVLKDRGLDLLERNLHAGAISKQLNNFTAFADYEIASHNWITSFISNTRKGMKVEEAVKKAEESTALFQGFTSKTNTPPLMRSQVVQALMPLQNQQLAYARSLLKHAWEGKTITEKGIAAAKLAISGTALGALEHQVFGDKGESPLNPTNWVPFGGVLQRGMGGPILSSTENFVNAQSFKAKMKSLISAAFLMQNKIPAGAQVGRAVTGVLFPEKRHSKKDD